MPIIHWAGLRRGSGPIRGRWTAGRRSPSRRRRSNHHDVWSLRGVGLGGFAEYVITTASGAVKVDDYFRWDAMVGYKQPKWGVQLNLMNLTNRLNYDALIPSDRGRSVPGTNLQALVAFTYKFF